MRYDEYRYLWQPRPGSKQAIPLTAVAERERQGAWAQVKKQGTANGMYVSPPGPGLLPRRVTAMNRHHGEHKRWQPIPQTHTTFVNLPGTGWYVFCSELMHNKVADPRLKNINYIHDILVMNGEYLVGTTFAERQDMLQKLFPDTVAATGIGYRAIDAYTWLAVNYKPNLRRPGFVKLWRSLTKPEDEGLVFKMPDAKLQFCHKETANDAWQFKCRRPSANVSH
jgi:hypothetical protein